MLINKLGRQVILGMNYDFSIYSGVVVLLAIVELITMVLACSYIAQISRRRRRDEMFTRAATANEEEYQHFYHF